jgi:hypothetical protein
MPQVPRTRSAGDDQLPDPVDTEEHADPLASSASIPATSRRPGAAA